MNAGVDPNASHGSTRILLQDIASGRRNDVHSECERRLNELDEHDAFDFLAEQLVRLSAEELARSRSRSVRRAQTRVDRHAGAKYQ